MAQNTVGIGAGEAERKGRVKVVVNVRYWHKADLLNALTNVRFWGQSGRDQTLLTNLDS